MSAVDVYRIQQTLLEAKIVFDDELLEGGDKLTLINEFGDEMAITVPVPAAGEKPFLEIVVEGGHVYTLKKEFEDGVKTIEENHVLNYREVWKPNFDINLWDGILYDNGFRHADHFTDFIKAGSYNIFNLTFDSTYIGGQINGATIAAPAYARITPTYKGKKLKKFDHLNFTGSATGSPTSMDAIMGARLFDETTSTIVCESTQNFTCKNSSSASVITSQKFEILEPDHDYAVYLTFAINNAAQSIYPVVTKVTFTKE